MYTYLKFSVTKAASVVDAQDPQDITRFPYLHYSFSCVDKAIGKFVTLPTACALLNLQTEKLSPTFLPVSYETNIN